MNKYEVVCFDSKYSITEDFENNIAEAISYYKGLCSCSTLSTCTIQLRKNGCVINQAKFIDLEVNG